MVRAAAGYSNGDYSGETSPIIWNRVYVLPDHVFFSHQQHVTVGGLKCQNCHGKVEEMETVRVVDPSELEPVAGNDENKLTRPTLTMGWCIECHGKVGISITGNDVDPYYEEIHRRLTKRADIYKKYLDDEKVTVSELGGWECSKCHY